MLYSKNGSYPKHETDGTEGWIEVPDEPIAPEGKEVVWWYPPGWVIRDPQPAPVDGYVWKWNQDNQEWIDYPVEPISVDSISLLDATLTLGESFNGDSIFGSDSIIGGDTITL